MSNKEVLGILVSYRVKVKLVVSRGGYVIWHRNTLDFIFVQNIVTLIPNTLCFVSDVSVELPFVLMHPKPSEQPNSRPQSGNSSRLCHNVCMHVLYIWSVWYFLKRLKLKFRSKPVWLYSCLEHKLKGSYGVIFKIIIWCNRICWHALMFKKHIIFQILYIVVVPLIGQLTQCFVIGRTPQARVGNVMPLSIIASFSFRSKYKDS